MDLTPIISLLIEKGVDALPIVSFIFAVIIWWYWRADSKEWSSTDRNNLERMITAVEKNTSSLNRMADMLSIRREDS